MTALEDWWAKSPARGQRTGEALTAHLANTLAAAHAVHSRIGSIPGLPEAFWRWVAWAALAHDAGKVATGFQHSLGNGAAAARWGHRHEVLSLGFLPGLLADTDDVAWVALGVATHHRALSNARPGKPALQQLYPERVTADELADMMGPIDPFAAAELDAWLRTTAAAAGLPTATSNGGPLEPGELPQAAHRLLHGLFEEWECVDHEQGLVGVLLQGAVTMADHLSSAYGAAAEATWHTVQPFDAGYRRQLEQRLTAVGYALRSHQRACADTRGHVLVRAPTGSGKTKAALLWGATQVEELRQTTGGEPRLFYTLPYLASINAMARQLPNEFGHGPDDCECVGVAHSRAASYYLECSLKDEEESDAEHAHKARSRAAATRLFRETVRVGTPYQLMRAALAGPAHSSVLVDTANSVFVLDELHAYDARRLGMLLGMLRLWIRLGGRVAVLSATLPNALAAFVGEALHTTPPIIQPQEAWPVRHRLRLDDRHITDPSTIETVNGRLRAGQSVLVVANNVRDAQHLYAELKPTAEQLYDSEACWLLHSRFRRDHRAGIEEGILNRFGTNASRIPGLVVATQTVEVSLDIDFGALHTSGAPLEALLQRFGRTNRLGRREAADVIVHQPTYAPRRRSTDDYADGVYDREPTELSWQILTRVNGHTIDERDTTGWLDEIYGSAWGQRWQQDVRHYWEKFEHAFLELTYPFEDDPELAQQFQKIFDGVEAVLAHDRDAYADALAAADGGAGRLLAENYLVPLPFYRRPLGKWDHKLEVTVIDGDYDPEHGLMAVRSHSPTVEYRPGEVL